MNLFTHHESNCAAIVERMPAAIVGVFAPDLPTFKVSRNVWNALSTAEQDIMRQLAPSFGVASAKQFIRALRSFGGQWQAKYNATKNGRLYTWSSDSGQWFDIGAQSNIQDAIRRAETGAP